jgi:hypothetical protein
VDILVAQVVSDSLKFPFSHVALAIRDEHHLRDGCDALEGHKKVPVPADRGN